MSARLSLLRPLFMASVFAACAAPGADAPEDAASPPAMVAAFTAEFFHGDWCQRFMPPPEGDPSAQELKEEVLHLRFEPGGRFALGQSPDRLTSIGEWSFTDGVLRMPGNPASSRPKPERISADAFGFKFMGVPVEVTRGACTPA